MKEVKGIYRGFIQRKESKWGDRFIKRRRVSLPTMTQIKKLVTEHKLVKSQGKAGSTELLSLATLYLLNVSVNDER